MKYNNILVGTDGTAIMDAVFDECAFLVQLMGATIPVAYVLDVTGLGAQPIAGGAKKCTSLLNQKRGGFSR